MEQLERGVMRKILVAGGLFLVFVASMYAVFGARLLMTDSNSKFEVKPYSASFNSDLNAPPVEWNRTYQGLPLSYGTLDQFHDAIKTSDGGYALVGSTIVNGGMYWWLVRTDANGNMLWNRTYSHGNSEAFSLVQTSDGGFVIAGVDNHQGFVIRTDSNGNQYLLQNYTSGDGFYSVARTLDGNYVVAGCKRTGIIITNLDFYLVKLDSVLNHLWDHTYDVGGDDITYSVIQASDGGYVLVGTTTNGDNGSEDGWLVKTDSSGNTGTGWTQKYGGKGDDELYSVIEIGTGQYLAGGRTGSFGPEFIDNPWLVACRQPAGYPPLTGRIWDLAYDETTVRGIPAVFGIAKDDNGGYVLALADGLAGIDSTGNLLWVKKFSARANYYLGSSVIKNTDGSYSFAGTAYDDANYTFCLAKLDIEPVYISALSFTPTNPPPFVNSTVPRQWEPVQIRASMFGNRTHTNVDTALLFYNVNGSQLWNTTMNFDSALGQWVGIVPGQPGNSTVRFYVKGWIGPSSELSATLSYVTVSLAAGDVNGDGIVDGRDSAIISRNVGKP